MNPIIGPIISGAIQAIPFGLLIWLAGAKRGLWLNAGGLVLAGLLYVLFAARAGAVSALPLEITGAAAVSVFAVVGIRRRSSALLALGWALHPVWDIALHTHGLGSYAPDNYALWCAGVDLSVAALVLLLPARSPAIAARAA